MSICANPQNCNQFSVNPESQDSIGAQIPVCALYDQAYSTALHEAGHAVVARELGLVCGDVSIEPSEDELGYAVVVDPVRNWERGDGPRRPLMERHVMSLFAGGEAEILIANTNVTGDGPDCTKATNCIAAVGVRGAEYVMDDVWERYERKLRLKSMELVRRHRRKIEFVAQALRANRTLSGADVDAILERLN